MGDMNYDFGEFIRKSKIGIISKDKVDSNGNRVVEVFDTGYRYNYSNHGPRNLFYIQFKDDWFQEKD